MDQPILLVDIDGVLSVFGFDPTRPPVGPYVSVDGIIHLLSATAAAALARLAGQFQLVWCSGWEEKADEYLPFALGVPAGLEHLVFASGEGDRHWKLEAIDRFAGPGRALAWIDDAHDASCHAWAAQRPGPTLLVATEPATGLTSDHAQRLTDWAAHLAAEAGQAD